MSNKRFFQLTATANRIHHKNFMFNFKWRHARAERVYNKIIARLKEANATLTAAEK